MLRIGVLASGRGSNFQSIIDGIREGDIDGKIAVLATDNPEAKAIGRAESNGIPVETVERKSFGSKAEMNARIAGIMEEKKVGLIVLAGYMQIITDELLVPFKWKIINIHPALLPSFPGLHAQKQAFDYGVRVSGCTVHFVDGGMDTGPIIEQTAVYIGDCRSADEVSGRILPYEHKLMRKVVADFCRGRYIIEGRKVRYEPM